MFNELLKIVGTDRIHTTPYHPPAKGLDEKWHRHLKASLMCCALSTDWYFTLSSCLLGLKTAVRLDTGLSAAEMMFGQTLQIPGDFCNYTETNIDSTLFMNEFCRYILQVKAVPTNHKSKKTPPDFKPFHFDDLNTCTHVLKLIRAVKPPLVRPYTGPQKVLERHPSDKYFKIEVHG